MRLSVRASVSVCGARTGVNRGVYVSWRFLRLEKQVSVVLKCHANTRYGVGHPVGAFKIN